ncbi:MAG TPA: hypothetical protein VIN60_07635 [Anaerolineales bacterium]
MASLVKSEIIPQVKKSVDPLSVLTIGVSFAAGSIASGFLAKIGEDAWEAFKTKLDELMNRKRNNQREFLLTFEFIVKQKKHPLYLEIILTNPSQTDINTFLHQGLKELDNRVPILLKHTQHIRQVVFEYKDGKLKPLFGVRKDGAPLSIEFKD